MHIFWRRRWHPTPVLLPGKSHWWRSLVGYSPWGCRVRQAVTQHACICNVIDMTEHKSAFLLFIFYLCHLFFVPPLFLFCTFETNNWIYFMNLFYLLYWFIAIQPWMLLWITLRLKVYILTFQYAFNNTILLLMWENYRSIFHFPSHILHYFVVIYTSTYTINATTHHYFFFKQSSL